jgi:hypothetical protein
LFLSFLGSKIKNKTPIQQKKKFKEKLLQATVAAPFNIVQTNKISWFTAENMAIEVLNICMGTMLENSRI